MSVMVGLIPAEVLSELVTAADASFDTTVDLYAAGAPDLHGERTYPDTPVEVPARIVQQIEAFWDASGQQELVSVQRIYLPASTVVTTNDKLVRHGANVSLRWPPILGIDPIPDVGAPVLLRVRTGAA